MNKLIIITGPTGVGKSALSLKLAKKLDTEIISADSMQIYKGFDIGTAKVTNEEMQAVKHYMIDIVDADKEFSVKEYQSMASDIIDKIHKKNKIPIVVGGTGLYINSLIYNLNFEENNSDSFIRSILYDKLDKYGIEYIRSMLKYVDYDSFIKLHTNDYKRNIRALEYFFCINRKYSERKNEFRVDNKKYDWYLYVLTRDRDDLYNDINKRVDIMFENGLLNEFNNIMLSNIDPNSQSLQAIGYKELVKYKNGDYNLDIAKELIKQHSRNYAKRQLTWFRNDPKSKFIDVGKNKIDDIIKQIMEDINVSNWQYNGYKINRRNK